MIGTSSVGTSLRCRLVKWHIRARLLKPDHVAPFGLERFHEIADCSRLAMWLCSRIQIVCLMASSGRSNLWLWPCHLTDRLADVQRLQTVLLSNHWSLRVVFKFRKWRQMKVEQSCLLSLGVLKGLRCLLWMHFKCLGVYKRRPPAMCVTRVTAHNHQV